MNAIYETSVGNKRFNAGLKKKKNNNHVVKKKQNDLIKQILQILDNPDEQRNSLKSLYTKRSTKVFDDSSDHSDDSNDSVETWTKGEGFSDSDEEMKTEPFVHYKDFNASPESLKSPIQKARNSIQKNMQSIQSFETPPLLKELMKKTNVNDASPPRSNLPLPAFYDDNDTMQFSPFERDTRFSDTKTSPVKSPYKHNDDLESEQDYDLNQDSENETQDYDLNQESDDDSSDEQQDGLYNPNRNFEYYDMSDDSEDMTDYRVPEDDYEYLENIDLADPIDEDHYPTGYANESEVKNYSNMGDHMMYFSRLRDIGSIERKFKQHLYKNVSNDEQHVNKESIMRKCYNQKIAVAIHEKIQNHYNVKNISLLEDYEIFDNAEQYKQRLYADFLRQSTTNKGLVLEKQYIDDYVRDVSKNNDKLIHINPFIASKHSDRESSVFLENQFTFIRNNIFAKKLKLISGSQNSDRQIYSGELMGVPVILKVQDFMDPIESSIYYGSTRNPNHRMVTNAVDSLKLANYEVLMNVSKYSDSKIKLSRQRTKHLFRFFKKESEALNESTNGICLSNMNHVNHLFPFLYYSCLDLDLDHEKQTASFKIITIQEKMGSVDMHRLIRYPANYGFVEGLEDDLFEKLKFYDSLLVQLCFGLLDAEQAMQFVHFDVRLPNITVEKTNQEHLMFKRNGKTYKIPTNGYLFRLIDFGRSHVLYDGISTEISINDLEEDQDYSKLYFVDMMKFVRMVLQGEDPHLFELIVLSSNNPKYRDAMSQTFTYRFMEYMLECGLANQRTGGRYRKVFEPRYCDSDLEKQLETHEMTKNIGKPFRSFLSCVMVPEKYALSWQNETDLNPEMHIKGLGYFKADRTYSFFQPHELEQYCSPDSHIVNIFEKTNLFDSFRL